MVISSIKSVNKAVNSGIGINDLAKVSDVSFGNHTCAKKCLSSISQNFSSPHQRAILGLTALCTQPFIDLYNKHINKEDKPVTVARTIAKIIVGTAIGVMLRGYAIKAIKNYTNYVKCGKYSQCLLPKKIIEKMNKNPGSVDPIYLLNYRNGLGTFLGVMGGLFTNFFIDAPLTKKLTNLIHDMVFKKEDAYVK